MYSLESLEIINYCHVFQWRNKLSKPGGAYNNTKYFRGEYQKSSLFTNFSPFYQNMISIINHVKKYIMLTYIQQCKKFSLLSRQKGRLLLHYSANYITLQLYNMLCKHIYITKIFIAIVPAQKPPPPLLHPLWLHYWFIRYIA